MSPRTSRQRSQGPRIHAPVFAALGDETRLVLISKLVGGQAYSISQLSSGSPLTRQAITKHLLVLERAGLVRNTRSGRERRFVFNPQPMQGVNEYLVAISEQWGATLSRLKAFVES